MDKRTERLRELMAAHRMNAGQVAELLGRTNQTVRAWRCEAKQTDGTRRIIPALALEVLEMKLAGRNRRA